MNDLHRAAAFRRCDRTFIKGLPVTRPDLPEHVGGSDQAEREALLRPTPDTA